MGGRVNILIVAGMREGECFHACKQALLGMGHNVTVFNDQEIFLPMAHSLVWRAVGKITAAPVIYRYNRELLGFLKRHRQVTTDLILISKGQYLLPETIQQLKERTGALVFNWHADDYFSPTLSSRCAIRSIPVYDCIFAHAKANVLELVKAGARRAEYLPLGADPTLYNPIDPDSDEVYQTDVLYIGIRRKDREETLARMVSNSSPYKLEVRGYQWDHLSHRSPLRQYVRSGMIPWVHYGRLIRRAKITLVLLTRFDTGLVVAPLRIFEIPAAGGFMLAERGSGEAAEFFREGEEIACFGDIAEMRNKIDYFLRHDEERRKIAFAGQRRAVRDGYFYTNRMERVIQVYHEIRQGPSPASGERGSSSRS